MMLKMVEETDILSFLIHKYSFIKLYFLDLD